jgi:hypothetical protein
VMRAIGAVVQNGTGVGLTDAQKKILLTLVVRLIARMCCVVVTHLL